MRMITLKERKMINYKKDLHHLKLQNNIVTEEAWIYLQVFIWNLWIFIINSIKMIYNVCKIMNLKRKIYLLKRK